VERGQFGTSIFAVYVDAPFLKNFPVELWAAAASLRYKRMESIVKLCSNAMFYFSATQQSLSLFQHSLVSSSSKIVSRDGFVNGGKSPS
jgi:hypothetical protein